MNETLLLSSATLDLVKINLGRAGNSRAEERSGKIFEFQAPLRASVPTPHKPYSHGLELCRILNVRNVMYSLADNCLQNCT